LALCSALKQVRVPLLCSALLCSGLLQVRIARDGPGL
jgi:hypothetical protein